MKKIKKLFISLKKYGQNIVKRFAIESDFLFLSNKLNCCKCNSIFLIRMLK